MVTSRHIRSSSGFMPVLSAVSLAVGTQPGPIYTLGSFTSLPHLLLTHASVSLQGAQSAQLVTCTQGGLQFTTHAMDGCSVWCSVASVCSRHPDLWHAC